MKTNNINNTNFQGLHVTHQTLKKIGCTREMLLNNPSIKDCANKYDVLVTTGKKRYVIDRRDGFTKDKYLPTAYIIGTIWAAPHIVEWLSALGINDFSTVASIGFAMLALAGFSIIKMATKRLNEIKVQGAAKVEKNDTQTTDSIYLDEYKTKGATTETYSVRRDSNGIIKDVPDLVKQISEKEYKYFYWGALKDAKLDDMFTPKKYLAELENIKKGAAEFNIDDVFKFPINKGGDTLLTAFFDVAIPDRKDEEGMEAYYKILQEISKTDKSNFDKTDSHGISILEKIMNTENEFIIPLIKGCKFSYSPFLKYAYDNIQNQTFKNQLKQTIDFNFELLESKNRK